MTVVAAARRVDRLDALAAEVDGVHAMRCDVASDDDLRAVVGRAVGLGPLAVVVNNAGISDAPAPAIDEDPAAFRRTVDVNLTATFVLSALAARTMVDGGIEGSIVNVASVHGLVASAPNLQAGYVASKSAVVGLTRDLAVQWARHRLRVNAIAPGYFRTELTDELIEAETGLAWIERNTPMRRVGELGELDGVVLLLASKAGGYLTGQTIVVDGGWTAR